MDVSRYIRGCPIFCEIGEDAAARLSRIAGLKRTKRGETIFAEGDRARAMYILIEGAVQLVKGSPEGREQFVRNVGRGETFAEAAMFAGELYPVTAVSKSPSELIVIEKAKLTALVKTHPEVGLAMMGAMAKLLRHWSALLTDVSLSSVEARLASWILRRAKQAGRDEFKLGIHKRELAFRLGTVPETLSRNLKRLAETGAISVRGETIKLNNINKLKKLSGV